MDPLTFMQLADTQFGMFRNFIDLTPERLADYNSRGLSVRRVEPFDGFAPETERFEKAVDAANTIRPAFVAICGDMVNDPTDEAQIAELNRISGGLSSEVPLYQGLRQPRRLGRRSHYPHGREPGALPGTVRGRHLLIRRGRRKVHRDQLDRRAPPRRSASRVQPPTRLARSGTCIGA